MKHISFKQTLISEFDVRKVLQFGIRALNVNQIDHNQIQGTFIAFKVAALKSLPPNLYTIAC